MKRKEGGLGIFNIQLRLEAIQLQVMQQFLTHTHPKPWHILYAFKYDYFLKRIQPTHSYLSHTHMEILSPEQHKLTTVLLRHRLTYVEIASLTKLGEIYNKLQLSINHTPAISNKNPTLSYSDLFLQNELHPLPNYLKTTNFHVTHQIVNTNYYYRHKFQSEIINDKCRKCKNSPETIYHILMECNTDILHHLLQLCTNTTSRQICLQSTTENHKYYYIQSLYRHITLEHHIKHLTGWNDNPIANLYRNARKYKDLFKPP